MEGVMMQELPCKFSHAPAVKNRKRRSISVVCCLPPGCSFATPSQDSYSCGKPLPLDVSVTPIELDEEEGDEITPLGMQLDEELNSNASHKAGATIEEDHAGQPLVAQGQNGKSVLENDGANDQWWMRSKVYPPPKRRPVSAIRHYPRGCGRDLGSTVAGFNSIRVQHEKINSLNNVVSGNNAEVSNCVGDTNGNSKEAGEVGAVGSVNGAVLRNVSPSVMVKQLEKAATVEKIREVERQKVDDKVSVCAELNRSKGKDLSVDNSSYTSQHKVVKPKIKIRFKGRTVEESTANILFSKSPSKRANERTGSHNQLAIKKSPVKVVCKKKVGIKQSASKYAPSFPHIDRCIPGDADLEEYASRVMLQSGSCPSRVPAKKSVLAFNRPGPTNIKLGKTVAKKSIPRSQASSSGLNEHWHNTANFGPKQDNGPTDPRGKVKRCLRLFQIIFRNLLQEVESGNKLADMERNRIDLRTARILGELNETLNRDVPIVGSVPGVEVGDEYRYRAELSILGLHRPPQGGIDSAMWRGKRVATSIVASGGYTDDMENENVLIYTGAGGQPTKKPGHTLPQDQKLERGNLALKNSIDMKTPVRVIHGQNIGESGKVVMNFTYDGLYKVEEFWRDKQTYVVKGVTMTVAVFRFCLRRLEGQPELNWSKLKKVQKSKVRKGLCSKDISLGQEKLPICVINTIDNKLLRQFRYITKSVYPSWYQKRQPKGCNCKGRCSDVMTCSCAAKNRGQIPFNFNGAIVQAKQLIYECGPMCGCPPSCYNRVSQHGIKFLLEVFKTARRGWGVRSLCSIPSGSFVCEYIGELLLDQEAEKRKNDEYLFDIGHNYDDSALWEGLPSDALGIGIRQPSTDMRANSSEEDEQEGFTIDALEMGNVGRFINHSCSPNLYAQNVLFDHDDKKMPHIMFFAAENIPPLKELTYHYNYIIGSVHDSEGNVKVKECYCGSSECRGRLY